MTLRSAYSETRQFLFAAGNTTLTLPAAAGDTNLKVASVTNFVVGDTLQIGDADGDDHRGRHAGALDDAVRGGGRRGDERQGRGHDRPRER